MKNQNSIQSTDIDTDKCVAQVGGNRFNLVLIAAQRAREIRRQSKATAVRCSLSALNEIQEGKIGIEYLKRIKSR